MKGCGDAAQVPVQRAAASATQAVRVRSVETMASFESMGAASPAGAPQVLKGV
jgi:hypothetical protein